jgi:hypothetical protein
MVDWPFRTDHLLSPSLLLLQYLLAKTFSYFAQKNWSGYDLCVALLPYGVAGVFSFLAFVESKRGQTTSWRIGAAASLLLSAGLLALVSIHISSSQASALAHADGQYDKLQAQLIETRTGIDRLPPELSAIHQEIENLKSNPSKQDTATQAAVQRLLTQVATASETVQRIQDASRSPAVAPPQGQKQLPTTAPPNTAPSATTSSNAPQSKCDAVSVIPQALDFS